MDIVYIVPSLDNVGPTNVLFDLVKGFYEYECNIKVISLRPGELDSEFSKYSHVIIGRNYFDTFKLLMENVNQEDVIVHSHGFIPDSLNAFCSLFKKYRSISTIHNFIELDYCFIKGRVKGIFFTKLHKLLLSRIKYPISCSKSAMEFNNLSPYYVFNGVSDKSEFKKEKKEKKEKIKLVYVGSFNKRKNLKVILESFNDAINPKLELIIVGDGDGFIELKNQYNNDRIKFLGRKKNPFLIVNDCDYVISSSLAEGFPLAILESLSCGLNYILSDIPPHREIHNIVSTGYLIPNNKNDFKSCFERLDSNFSREKIKSIYKDKLSVEIMVNNYKKIYED